MARPSWPERAGIAFLLLQAGFLLADGHLHELALWAPLHEQAWFHIDASVNGRALSQEEIAARYGVRGWFWNERTAEAWQLNDMAAVLEIIADTEAAAGPGAAQVRVRYRRNGRPLEEWQL